MVLTLYLIRVGNYKSSLFWEIMINIGYYLDCYISFSSSRWSHYLKPKATNSFSEDCTNTSIESLGKVTEQSHKPRTSYITNNKKTFCLMYNLLDGFSKLQNIDMLGKTLPNAHADFCMIGVCHLRITV